MNQMYGFEGEVKAKYPFVHVVYFFQTLVKEYRVFVPAL